MELKFNVKVQLKFVTLELFLIPEPLWYCVKRNENINKQTIRHNHLQTTLFEVK